MVRLASLLALIPAAIAVSTRCLVKDFNEVGCAIAEIEKDVKCYHHEGGIFRDIGPVIFIQRDVQRLQDVVESTIDDIRHACPFDDKDAVTIAGKVLDLKDPIINLIHKVESKKYDFDHSIANHISASPLVKSDLIDLEFLLHLLICELERKFPAEYVPAIDAAVAEIDLVFKHALKVTYCDVSCIVRSPGHRRLGCW